MCPRHFIPRTTSIHIIWLDQFTTIVFSFLADIYHRYQVTTSIVLLIRKTLGISLKSTFKSDYRTICENLNLIYKDFKIGKTDDLSYIKSGFCPISLKLIEKAGEGEWTSIKDSLNLIPGETVFPNDESEISNPTEKINTIFVVFVGGVTYSEIEGIRFLNRKYKQIYDRSDDDNKTRKQFIIITTQIFNSKRLYDNLGKNFGSVYTMKKFYDDLQETPTKKK